MTLGHLSGLLLILPAALFADETLVILRPTGAPIVENAPRARRRFAPCSTFKIPNSLIALETGEASDAAFPLAYDPKRDGDQSGVWARDHDLRSALRHSVAWYYQEMARRIGPARMQDYLSRFQYGNRDISGGIDRFWLGAGLRISAEEQAGFLRRLHEQRLGISSRSAGIVEEMLLLETTPGYRWYGKTGTCSAPGDGPVAWHVGFVERGGATSYYALNFGGTSVGDLVQRRPALVREKLSKAGLVDPRQPAARLQMEARVRGAVSAFPGTVRLYAKNLDTGQTFGLGEDEPIRTASTIKLPIMAAVFSAVAQGKAQWDETLVLREQDKVSGTGILREMSDGVKLPLRDLVNLMIVVSDNTATNLILDRLTTGFVNTEIARFGLEHTRSLRKILRGAPPPGDSPFGLGVSTPRDMVTLLEKLARGEVVSPEASSRMIAILQRQQDKEGIGRGLPGGEVASKSGTLDRLRSDAGIVSFAGGRIAVAITAGEMRRTDWSPDNAGKILLSTLTGMLLEGLSAPVADLGAPEQTIELHAPMDHVQGIEVDGDRLWVTWVDKKNKTGRLGEFELAGGKLLRSVPLQKGERYHPGGMAADGDSLWMPVAEYKPHSSASIQRRNKKTLELEAEFDAPDHIGCVAVVDGRLYGGNWDARQIYIWDRSGRLLEKRENPSGTSFQDLKASGGRLAGGGLRADGGAIDWLDARELRLVRRIRAGKTNRGVWLTQEGMAVSGDRLYLLPEDAPSRLFVFRLPPAGE